jgi:hypothetical protein
VVHQVKITELQLTAATDLTVVLAANQLGMRVAVVVADRQTQMVDLVVLEAEAL